MSKILVTGHLGWIGSNFTKLLDSKHIKWIGLDRNVCDLTRQFGHFNEMVKDCDIVVHLAATPRIPGSWKNPDWYRTNNVSVTDRVARTCAQKGKYLIFASSSSIYGDGAGPLNPYSWTKLAGEQSIQMYGRSLGLNYTITRIFTNYGEDDRSNLVIGKWLDLHRKGEPLTVRGQGQQSRDFIHVSDTAKALLAIAETQPTQQIIDIGTGTAHKLIDIAALFNSAVIFEPELPGYAEATRADLSRTQRYITWKPEIELTSWLDKQLAK
jgi:UDP-glucose 4-epimerase